MASSPSGWVDHIGAACDEVRAAGRWRRIRDLDAGTPDAMLVEAGRPIVNFASNDYLGLSQHPAPRAAATEALERFGTGAGASRLVVGARPVHRELEQALADWKGTEAALLFPTGYAANLGTLTTFAGPEVLVCSDELNHASIIDGTRLARGHTRVFRHRDLDHLDDLLAAAATPLALVVSDAVFSMDGDDADVVGLAEVCARRGALLVLDEAHAVLGPDVTVAAATLADAGVPLLRMGTLSKALGSLGGFVAGPRSAIDLLVNRARSFIFTTAPTPADTAAALAAVRLLGTAEGRALLTRLRGHVDRLLPGHPSPILPVVIGPEDETVAASDRLLDHGLFVPAIRPPTVAPGTSRLRIALSATHTDTQVTALVDALAGLGLRPGPSVPSPS